ncbi:MAG: class I SAM-dependent methyltransferase [Anaerolineales bacterium]|nr:class I SAM-dependent methyltransferase [Chloroflexota bacterium]MBL6979875.1 class I SAM-dependent methyltransferase [Anaerolineales bacterium]
MTTETEIKQNVREFYDKVGWQEVSEGIYQNARYEDLRPVSHEYIHRCHMRVLRHLKAEGKYLLDAGSGPIQYPEYLEYSKGYKFRVCADISHVALKDACKRTGEHGLCVVADVANLPFKPGVFEGIVSLHTIHHLPSDEHISAYQELYRVLAKECQVVVVNGWGEALIPQLLAAPMRWTNRGIGILRRVFGIAPPVHPAKPKTDAEENKPKSTFVRKYGATWLKSQLTPLMHFEIYVWRGVSVKHLRTFIHQGFGGRLLLRLLFWLEDLFPHFFGEKGQYPMFVIRKS